MKENKTPWAIVQIGLGLLCLAVGLSGLILSQNYLLSIESLLLGGGVLLFGLSNNNRDKTEKGKLFYTVGSVLFYFGVGFIFYNTFFRTN